MWKKFVNIWRSIFGSYYRVIDKETGEKLYLILIYHHNIYVERIKK